MNPMKYEVSRSMVKGRAVVFQANLFLIFLLFFSGCAHQSPPPITPYEGNESAVESTDRPASVFETTALYAVNDQDNALADEDLSFLDEEEPETVEVADPLKHWNRAMYHFNDKFYFWLLKPVTQGYKAVVPETGRIGIKNFFYNLMFPIRFAGCLLQARGQEAGAEMFRFVFNTTIGVLGFGNPAKNYPDLNPPEEDPGQAFGRWGVGNGFYIVWPFLGPSTLRDSVGLVGNYFLNPVTYVDPSAASMGITACRVVNDTSFRIGDYESLKKGAIDPYTSLRNAYVTGRKKKVNE